jgi:Alginate export
MCNRHRADRQGTSGELCSPRLVRQSACTNPIIPAMTQPSAYTPDGAPPRRLAGGTRTRTARCQGVAVIMGLALQLLSCVHGVLPGWVEAGQAASEPQRPALPIGNAVRYDEDWSVLRGWDLSKTDDFWDRFKFIPLTQDQTVWLTLGGDVRERLEYFNEFEFGSSEPERSDAYLLSRFRLSVDFHVSRYFRIFAEGKSALSTDRDLLGGNTTTFMDTIDLQNGFADIMIPLGDQASVTLRGGRQELIFGAQRLVGVSDFTNVRRTFDGGAGIVRVGDWTITPLWVE